MASSNGSPPASRNRTASADESMLGSALTSRHIEAFSRKLTSTANQLVGDGSTGIHYQHAMRELHRELHRPGLQRRILSYTQASPTELVRSKLFTNEIQHRAVAHVPDEILSEIPEEAYDYSLFQGFEATIPQDGESEHRKKHKRHNIKNQKLLESAPDEDDATALGKARKEQRLLNRKLEMMAVRKNMCSSEIREIDAKIANLNGMRKIVLDRLEDLEQEEVQLEQDLQEMGYKLEELHDEEHDDTSASGAATPVPGVEEDHDSAEEETSFMSQSIYEKLPSPKSKRHKPTRRKSMAIRHEHFDPGTAIAELQAHSDMITSLDFDTPFGTMVSSALDDTVRVWDLNAGRCLGLLEGHQASVRCLQVDESLVATGSMDASIRLWDLDQIEYAPRQGRAQTGEGEEEEEESAPPPSSSSTADCHILTLTAHVAEITALNFHGGNLVSGSADKTLRQWDLEKGRCVQTLDVLWAAAQASATISPPSISSNARAKSPSKLPTQWQNTGSRVPNPSPDFVGALQCFDAALACGTADGMVRLWDLRSGQVHRSLVGHTGAVTSLQFDERVLVTGSADRSIRIWDLRTGSIRDAYAYENPITSMMFDSRRIVAAAGENMIKVYDKTDGRHWDCGPAEGAVIERVRVRDGYLVGGRKDGMVSVFSC